MTKELILRSEWAKGFLNSSYVKFTQFDIGILFVLKLILIKIIVVSFSF